MLVKKLTKETNEIQRVITLKNNRNKRHKYREFVVEGHAAIDNAIHYGWVIKNLYFNMDVTLSDWAKKHIQNASSKVYGVTNDIMQKLSDKTETSELIAIVETSQKTIDEWNPQPGLIIVCDQPKSPNNLGMLIRSMVAFGASALILSGHSADEYDPACIKASVGTFFALPIYKVSGSSTFFEKINFIKQKHSVQLIATGNQGNLSIKDLRFTSDVKVLILGNETKGVSFGYKEICDQFVSLPLKGPFTSLNIAAAGSIFLYEFFS